MKVLIKIRLPKTQKNIKVTMRVKEESILEIIDSGEEFKKKLLKVRDDVRLLCKDAYAFVIGIEEQRAIPRGIIKHYEEVSESC